MKIYTKTGDKGHTALFGGTRVPKHHIRIESYGTIDELNSYLGLIRDQDINKSYKDLIVIIQHKLFTIGAILATDPKKETLKNGKDRLNIDKISIEDINLLEKEIDIMNNTLPPNSTEPFDANTLTYLNRLSDYLFVLARKLTYDLQANEIKWIPEKY